jgi:3-phenylpropionate/trans-cinnamate dioxygenase ferredoxin subunit
LSKFVLGPVEEFPRGTRCRVEVGGRGVAVFNVEGTFFALRDVCPHQGAELSAGTLAGAVSASQPGCYEYDAGRKLVTCPWHGWEYDLATGQSWFDPERKRVKPYDVAVARGRELVDTPGGRLPGPYVAETVSISVEREYVVITTDGDADGKTQEARVTSPPQPYDGSDQQPRWYWKAT